MTLLLLQVGIHPQLQKDLLLKLVLVLKALLEGKERLLENIDGGF